MAEESVQRRLAAILVADVVGYSALIRADEEGTRAAVRQHNTETIEPQIGAHNGRIFKTVGDGLLAEFASVVDAVRCAVEIQNAIKDHNVDVAADKRVEYRIGVNLGDVIAEGDDLHGDGVNVAARLEGLAEPQGICISASAFEQVRDKLDVGFEDLGDQQVKNIDRPVRAYRVLTDPAEAGKFDFVPAKRTAIRRIPAIATAVVVIIAAGILTWQQPWVERDEPANPDNMAFPEPNRPSIAVLPFENMSGDPKQDFLSDGISGDITTALSRVPEMFVIPRTTTRTYKGKPVTTKQVAEELGVRYVLEGSVQKFDDKVRVAAQLIDTRNGRHIWTEHYDREFKDTFDLQDEITRNVLTELEIRLTRGDYLSVGTKSLEAYQLLRSGMRLNLRATKEDHPQVRRLFQEAVALDPNYAFAWNMLGWNHQLSANRGWSEDPAQDRSRALELAHKALELDPSGGAPYSLLADISQQEGSYDEAVAYNEKAVALTPNNSIFAAFLARALILAGRAEEALPPIQRAKRFSPVTPAILSRNEGFAYYSLGRYDEAVAAFERARVSNPKGVFSLAFLAMTYADMGRMEEARAASQEVLKLSPSFSGTGFVKAVLPYRDQTKSERTLATLRQLGLAENQPLRLPDKPSVAVLPFKNLSGDSFAEVFAVDATENVVTALSQLPEMSVISRSSTLPYKDKSVDVRKVAEELGARYVLEGSVERSGDQVRITAKLTDTQKARTLLADVFNRELQDASVVQDEITLNVVGALEAKLVEGARERIVRGNTNSAEAYALVRRGLSLFQGDTQEENAKARRLFEEAVELDQKYSIAWHLLGYTHNAASKRRWGKGRAQERARAEKLARAASVIDPSASGPYILLSTVSQLALRYDEAITHGEKAVALAPNDAMTVAQMGRVLIFVGRPDEALPMIQRAVRLSPYTPPPILFFEGLGYHSLDRYAEAIRALDDASVRSPKKTLPFALLAITSADMGRIDEARVAVQAVLRVHPASSAEWTVNLLDYKDRAKSERAVATLVELGMPE